MDSICSAAALSEEFPLFCNCLSTECNPPLPTLSFAGYKPGACRQNPAVITALRVLFAPVPVVLLLIGLVLFYFYPINEERRGQIQQELQKAE